MFARPIGQLNNLSQPLGGGVQLYSQDVSVSEATAASTTLTASAITSGWIIRSGAIGAGFTDTWPSADSIIAQLNQPQVGDSWRLIYQNTIAQAMTFAAGTGIVSGTGTLGAAASVTRIYIVTLLANKRTAIFSCTTTNASKLLTNVPSAQFDNLMPGMGVTGTGIGASAVIVGLSRDTNTVTVDVNSTATADNITVTAFPRIRVDSIGTLAA